jgi:hypothetical protein
MLKTIKIFLGLIFLPTVIFSQNLGNSPYSLLGVGDLTHPALSHQQAMGGAGISFSLPFMINNLNPALNARLSKSKNTIYEAGVAAQLKGLRQTDVSQRDFGANLSYLIVGLPISSRMGGTFGISPYSNVSYNYTFLDDVEGSDFLANKTYNGSGGITNLFLSLGYDFTKSTRPDTLKHRFMVGGKANYLFGAIINELTTKLRTNNNTDFEAARYRRNGYSDFTFEGALAYTYKVKGDYKLNLGLVYGFGKDLKTKYYEDLRTKILNDPVDTVTVIANDIRSSVNLPSRIGFGLSFEKEFKWAIALDYTMQDWSGFKDQNNSIAENYTLGKSYTLALGGQYIPNYTSVAKGFWHRTLFKLGGQYTQTPVIGSGMNIRDLSISLGASIPLTRQNSFTLLNLALQAGSRGTTNNNLIRENYVRVHFGATINDRWFIKPKFN